MESQEGLCPTELDVTVKHHEYLLMITISTYFLTNP